MYRTKLREKLHEALAAVLPASFLMGFLITVSEPDLQVLADQVQSIDSRVLIFSVAGGVGFFLVLALLRMLFSVRRRTRTTTKPHTILSAELCRFSTAPTIIRLPPPGKGGGSKHSLQNRGATA